MKEIDYYNLVMNSCAKAVPARPMGWENGVCPQ